MPQFQDPQCRAATDIGHYCHDKYGAPFASEARPARSGSTCWYESMMRLEDERRQEQADLDALRADLAATFDAGAMRQVLAVGE